MRSRKQRRRICMRSIAVLLIAAMLGTGLPTLPVMAAKTQSISSECPTQKDTLLSIQAPENSEKETDTLGETYLSEETNPSGEMNLSEETDPSKGENPSEEKDPSEGGNPSEEKDPSKGENPSEEKDPSEGGNPSGEKDPSEEENSSGETDPSEGENPSEEKDPLEGEKDPSEGENPPEETDPSEEENLSEEDVTEETVSENGILQIDMTVSANEVSDDSMYRPENLPLIEHFELPESGVPDFLQTYGDLKSEYDARELGILSPIRNQNPWGTCWAFSALGAMESSLLQQGLGSSFDLSERHLAYFAYHTRSDALGNADGDTITNETRNYLNNGGHVMMAVSALMNWQGAADESAYPYSYSIPADLEQTSSQDTAIILKDCYMLSTKDKDKETKIKSVKALIQEYGCVMWSYYDAPCYYNSVKNAYYCNEEIDEKGKTNHAIMVVGWNDAYPKENFETAPSENGAWIVRNSWSENWGEGGYFYISYEDTSLGSGNPAAVMVAGLREEYDNNYFNSNTITGSTWRSGTKLAQIYTIKGKHADKEQLSAVSFLTGSLDTQYEIQIYKNPQKVNGVVQDPESGTPMLAQPVSGRTACQGLYTVELEEPIIVEKDDVIAVVIYFQQEKAYIYTDKSGNNGSGATSVNKLNAGESFTYSGRWYDLADYDCSLRINVLTKDVATTDEPVVTVENVTLKDLSGNSAVQLKWNSCANAKSYEVLRSSSKAGIFSKIAEQKSYEKSYRDSSVSIGNTYYYKVRAVFENGSVKESEAVGAELALSSTDVVVSKGNRIDITASLKPSNMHYTGLEWSAYRADGTPYDTEQTDSIFKVTGSDGREILRITGNTLSATGGSTDKEVYLRAESGALTARCHVVVNVPVTGLAIEDFKVNGEAKSPSEPVMVSDTIEVSVSPVPEYNADDIKCDWSTTNGNVLKIISSTDMTVTLQAEGAGNCVLRARTADGISIERKIAVQKKEEVYGIWLSDKELSEAELREVKVTLDKDGNFQAEGSNPDTRLDSKPEYSLTLGPDTADGADSIKVYAYALTKANAETDEDGRVTGGSLVHTSDCSYRSANPLIAAVSEDGVVTAKADGETDIFAYDTTGNNVYGSYYIKVSGAKPQGEDKPCPFDKAYKFSPAASAVSIHSYAIDGKSSAQLRIKDSFGREYTPQENAEYFTFTSAKPSVCIVDEKGEVTPNPAYKPGKNETVKVTAALNNDPGKRKVTFSVTILAVKQADSIQMLSVNLPDDAQAQDAAAEYTPAPETVSVPFKAGDTMTFSAKAYGRFGEEMTGTALQWSVTDTSIASVKLSKDKKHATVTFKKAGRTNLICQAKDTWKRSSSVQLVLLDTTVVPSEKQVALNLCEEMTEDNKRLSGEFRLRIPAGMDASTLEIKEIKNGKNPLTQEDRDRFSIVDKQNGSYSIAIDNSGDDGKGYADSIKPNTTYELTIGTTVKGLEIGDQAETFTVKVKAVSKKPSVSVASPTIDRIYTQPGDLKALLVIKAPDVVEDVRVLSAQEGQINQFDDYISIEKKGGQWYAVLEDPEAYQKTSIKGKLALKAAGYEEVVCNVTVKTPKKAKAVKQQTIPSIHIDAASGAGGSNTAGISLYNNTDKTVLTQMEVVSCTSAKLLVAAERDGTLKAAVKRNASYKNGETLTAKLEVMETDNAGKPVWADPVKVDVKVKVYTTTLPKAAIAQKTLTLNKQAPGEQAVTTLKLDRQNVSFTPDTAWKIYAYNNTSRKYDIDMTESGWQNITFDKESGMLRIGFQQDKAEDAAAGSYKFRITNHVKDHDTVSTDLTVKVIDILPTAAVKVSGKLDLVNRENMTLTGKLTMKNAVSQVKDVTILLPDEDAPADTSGDTSADAPKAHPYFKAVYKGSNTFDITLTEEGMRAKLETKKYTLPVIVTLEDGHEIKTELSLKPTQSVPKIKAPAAQTIYKYTGELTKDYNLSQSLPAGVRIAKIQAAKVPEGMGVVTKNGHVLVTLSDTGMKKGSYQVSVNVYFEGEQALTGYPDGKPLSVKITVKVEN